MNKSYDNKGPRIDTIMDALTHVGFSLPEGCTNVTIDDEQSPTRVAFICHVRRQLSAEEAKLMAQAVQLHKVRHRLKKAK